MPVSASIASQAENQKKPGPDVNGMPVSASIASQAENQKKSSTIVQRISEMRYNTGYGCNLATDADAETKTSTEGKAFAEVKMEKKLQVERWGCLELSFRGKTEGNPFTDYTIRGTFQGESETVVTDGFYDGDGVYRIRFMPSYTGEYQYTVEGTFGEAQTGRFSVTEAGRMAEWLTENGLDPRRVLAEDRSLTTAQNAVYTFDLLAERAPGVRALAIVSSDYHIATGNLLFGAESILRAPAPM